MDGDITAPGLTRYAALFVDVPNICPPEGRNNTDRISRVNWPALFSIMLDTLESERCECIGTAYTFAPEWQRKTPVQLKESLMDVISEYRQSVKVTSSPKDIDSMIISDLWPNLIELSRMQYEMGRPFPHEATILLASGDNVYAHAVSRIRQTFGDLLKLRLHTFSWKGSLAGSLAKVSQQVVLLDEHPQILLPTEVLVA
jgi:hypothetical protein